MLCCLFLTILIYFSEPPKSFTIIKENLPIELGTEITVVDGKLETVHCESRKSNPAPLLEWFLGKKFFKYNEHKIEFLKKDSTTTYTLYCIIIEKITSSFNVIWFGFDVHV